MKEEEIDRERERERESKDFNEENDANTTNETQCVDENTKTLPKENAIKLAELIKERCEHAKNLTVEVRNNLINEEGKKQFSNHMIDCILNYLQNSNNGEMRQMLFLGQSSQSHAFGFICGRSLDGIPYILHYDYTEPNLETETVKRAVEKMQAELKGLQVIKVPKLQAAPNICNFFQLMLMRYMKPEDIEQYLSKAGETQNNHNGTEYSVIKVEPGKLPEKLLSYYQTRKMQDAINTKGENVGKDIWEDLMKEGHIKLGGIPQKEKNVKPQNKIKLLNEKMKEDDESDMYSVISETKSEIAAECGAKRFFKKLGKHLKKCWKKIKGFLYGTRFTNNSAANNDLNSKKSNKLTK